MDEWANDPTFCDMAQLMGVELDSMDFEQVKQLFDSWDHGRHTSHGPKLEEESLLFGYFISPKIITCKSKKGNGHGKQAQKVLGRGKSQASLREGGLLTCSLRIRTMRYLRSHQLSEQSKIL